MVRKFALVLISALLLGCDPLATPEPAATSTRTVSPTPQPTPTPVPTSTATPAPKALPVEADGFSLSVPPELDFDLQGKMVGVFDQEGKLIISFIRTDYDGSSNSLQDVIDMFLDELSGSGGEFEQGESSPINIGGAEGISVALTGILFDAPIEGTAVAVNPRLNSVFFGLGVSNLAEDKDLWKTTGSTFFQSLIDSVEFIDVQTSMGTCTVSDDKTYGFTEQNPIRVGGDWLEGPAREEAYLDNLLGPNGETLKYEREGSFSSGDTILDRYHVTGPGIEVVLYLDENSYTPPLAPVGFTCVGEFPLSAP